jgi:uncharacterized protein
MLIETMVVIAVSVMVLISYDRLFRPDLRFLSRELPLNWPVHWMFACAVFSLVNAALEEAVFRGVLLDALVSQIGVFWAIFAQAAAFGVGHANGYPPGRAGMVLAGVYGVMLGALRMRSGGMLAPWVAHVCADATIFCIVIAAGR